MLTVCRNGSNWYLLQCKPRQDERAQLNLQQQNYSTFRPQLMSERSIRGKRQRILESLFPGYVFIQLSRDDNWAPIRSTRGVSRIVEFNHVPARVDEDVIAQLRERSQESIGFPAEPTLKPGEPLQIVQGPLSPLEGVFLSMQGDERVMILLNFLNRQQHVSVPLSYLERQRQ
ncbi:MULTISPECIES: transcription/translation regulatory transformer protein RfaH [Pseudomonas fluorescens group]|uniref:transcription/translation regulatory transformer protein RfaH n=1 Tax=Pseudomonas fluorescens group TaxID=136843 RepID=UPI00087951BE|nr:MULTISPECIES: transcription/translation regulatory transformer protein RfaH [Pseudomonas fluorescens group]WPC26720.1 transcription/translation regulatory transformer protein RfaH [Pseudomonas moraviensis]SDU39834.1 transcriptional antiterminator RfaH [Pseudomonas moraviensis]